MKWFALVLIATAAVLAGCRDSGRMTGVTNAATNTFSASLAGNQAVPPTGSGATGAARFDVMSDGTIHWSLQTTGLDTVLAAHIHAGKRGQNGDVVVPLYTGGPTRDLNVTGTITDPAQIAAAVWLFRSDSAYVNVHTPRFIGGEIRGQVLTAGGSDLR
jgi:hypothetical protein